jgi:hypothetical protein
VTEFGADAQSILSIDAVNANFAMGSFAAILADTGSSACENPAIPASGKGFASAFGRMMPSFTDAVGMVALAHQARYA